MTTTQSNASLGVPTSQAPNSTSVNNKKSSANNYASTVATQSDIAKYRGKYKELKTKVREIETENDQIHIKTMNLKRTIQRLRLERALLYERLEASYDPNVLGYDATAAARPSNSTSSEVGETSQPQATSSNISAAESEAIFDQLGYIPSALQSAPLSSNKRGSTSREGNSKSPLQGAKSSKTKATASTPTSSAVRKTKLKSSRDYSTSESEDDDDQPDESRMDDEQEGAAADAAAVGAEDEGRDDQMDIDEEEHGEESGSKRQQQQNNDGKQDTPSRSGNGIKITLKRGNGSTGSDK
ncbi:unnamed protein product [Sympodiomycopsis kandeliae]